MDANDHALAWGIIVRGLLDGSIPYSIAGETMDRISISATDAAALRLIDLRHQICAVPSRHFSQRDAAEILNLPFKHAHVLRMHPTPGGSHRIAAGKVRHLAQTRITLAELSARTGIHGTRLESQLEKDGCPRHDVLGWMRRVALAKISKY
jgi:hypothetical protein